MTRNILNYQGAVIGQITLPDDTSDAQWTALLAPYANPPATQQQLIAAKIISYEAAGDSILAQIKAQNTLAGISPAQSAAVFVDFGDVLQMVREGAFPTALYVLGQKSPSGFVTQDMINSWINMIIANL